MYLNICTNPSKFTFPGFDENFANFCTVELKYTPVEKKSINDPIQAL